MTTFVNQVNQEIMQIGRDQPDVEQSQTDEVSWTHSDTQKSRRQTKMLKDSVTMLFQAIIMPTIWQVSCKSISISNKDMATLIGKIWQS